jgi:NDP-sugar pyrophosphorylase family protein
VVEYLNANDNFGMRIEISRGEVLLDTGGGLKKAAYFFLDDAGRDEPFILHNVDVVSTIDLECMARFHRENGALATLAVQKRQSSRYLLFDERRQLCGRRSQDRDELVRTSSIQASPKTALAWSPGAKVTESAAVPADHLEARAFCGIHVISPRIFRAMVEEGVFSIIAAYLRLVAQGEKIIAFPADEYHWRDVGTPESLAQAAQEFSTH